MPGTVELLVWSLEKKTLDPAIDALLWGGNVGHAALRMIIPQDEIHKDDIERLKKTGINVIDTTAYYRTSDNQPERKPSYEIYFSFWPGKNTSFVSGQIKSQEEAPHFLTHTKDRIKEKEGLDLTNTDQKILKKLFNKQEMEPMFTRINSGLFGFIKHRGKKVFSGINAIVYLSNDQLDQLYNNIKKNTMADKVAENPTHRETILALYNDFKRGLWDERNISVMLQLLIKKEQELLSEEKLTSSQVKQLLEIQHDIKLINDSASLGVSPNYNLTFSTGGAFGLDAKRIIDAMCDIANEKKYGLLGWNCSATALYVFLQGFDPDLAPSMRKEVEKLKKALDIGKANPSTFTPNDVKEIATKLQSALYKLDDEENKPKKLKVSLVNRSATLFKQPVRTQNDDQTPLPEMDDKKQDNKGSR